MEEGFRCNRPGADVEAETQAGTDSRQNPSQRQIHGQKQIRRSEARQVKRSQSGTDAVVGPQSGKGV